MGAIERPGRRTSLPTRLWRASAGFFHRYPTGCRSPKSGTISLIERDIVIEYDAESLDIAPGVVAEHDFLVWFVTSEANSVIDEGFRCDKSVYGVGLVNVDIYDFNYD